MLVVKSQSWKQFVHAMEKRGYFNWIRGDKSLVTTIKINITREKLDMSGYTKNNDIESQYTRIFNTSKTILNTHIAY